MYDPNILRQASLQLEKQRRERQEVRELRQAHAYAKRPRLREIDRELRSSMARLATAAFRRGEDPGPALEQLRRENLSLQAERSAILGEIGLSKDALDDTPACFMCGDTGWRGTKMCQCLKKLCTEEQIRSLSSLLQLGEQSFDTFRMDFYSDLPWSEHDPSPRKNMELVYEVCLNYAQKFGRFFFKNLLLSGSPGLGKTFLSACIARTVSESGFSVVYDTAVGVLARFEDQMFDRDIQIRDETKRYLNCDLLILDDLGCERNTNFIQEALYTLINARLVAGRHTVISSNLTMGEVSRRYSPQIASRLAGEYHTLYFYGEDIRILKKNR